MAVESPRDPVQQRLEPMLALRRSDGSFAYRSGGPGQAECTCYALLALKAVGHPMDGDVARSLDWLASLEREDGGFAPQTSILTSNWVTGLISITMGAYQRTETQRKAVEWLLGITGGESARWRHVIHNLLGTKTEYPQTHQGWPWAVGTAAWLEPTVLGTLAMLCAQTPDLFPDLRTRIGERFDEARKMLLDRRCADGGWNYGAPIALGIGALSYPETTGMALFGLQGTAAEVLSKSTLLAHRMLAGKPHANGVSWLQLGLSAFGEAADAGEEEAIQCRNCLDYALRVLALKAIGGTNVFKA